MPEGDTILRTARTMQRALAGKNDDGPATRHVSLPPGPGTILSRDGVACERSQVGPGGAVDCARAHHRPAGQRRSS